MAKNKLTLESLMKDLQNKVYKPIYFFTGNEPYYIDKLTDFMLATIIPETEKAFNQSIIYGKDSDAAVVLNAVRRYRWSENENEKRIQTSCES